MQVYRSIALVPVLLTSYKNPSLFDGLGPFGGGILFCLFGLLDLWAAKMLSRENAKSSKRQSIFLAAGAILFFVIGIICFCLALRLKNL